MSLLKKMWKNNSKHKKLSEDWATGRVLGSQLSLTPGLEPTEKMFSLKYVGSVPAERACSAPATAAAIAQAITNARSSSRKLRRVEVTVSPQGIVAEDPLTSERLLDVSIYKISYCSADAVHSQVFAFIASGAGEALECHVFLCPKRKMARAATLAAAQSFNAAYQQWQTNQDRRLLISDKDKKIKKDDTVFLSPNIPPTLLIDFNGDDTAMNSPWVSFDEDGACDLWDDAPATRLLSAKQLVS